MSKRRYNFTLPHTVTGTELSFGLTDFQANPVYVRIPPDLRARIEAGAQMFGGGVTVTKADLDRLPNDVWEQVRQALGLP